MWTIEERSILLQGLKTFGNNYVEINKILPLRNYDQIRYQAHRLLNSMKEDISKYPQESLIFTEKEIDALLERKYERWSEDE